MALEMRTELTPLSFIYSFKDWIPVKKVLTLTFTDLIVITVRLTDSLRYMADLAIC